VQSKKIEKAANKYRRTEGQASQKAFIVKK
jgi:hypothetical protein